MEGKTYTQVLIDGKIYSLGGSEDEAYLQKAASYVNEKNGMLRKLPGFTKQSTDYQVAMAELNMADDYFKALERADEMERLKSSMEKETYSLKHELVNTQMKLEAVLKDLEDRQRQLEEITKKAARLEKDLRTAVRRQELEQAVITPPESSSHKAALKLVTPQNAKGDTELSEKNREDQEMTHTGEETEQNGEPGPDGNQVSLEAAVTELGDLSEEDIPDEELARKALQAAKKAGSRRGRRK